MLSYIPQKFGEDGERTPEFLQYVRNVPKHPREMTEDQILEWFISRRGGTKEEIKEKLGENYAQEIQYWYKRNHPEIWERDVIFLTGIGLEPEEWEIWKEEERLGAIVHRSNFPAEDRETRDRYLTISDKAQEIRYVYLIYDYDEDDALLRS